MTIRSRASEGEQIATLARRFGVSRQTISHQRDRRRRAASPPSVRARRVS